MVKINYIKAIDSHSNCKIFYNLDCQIKSWYNNNKKEHFVWAIDKRAGWSPYDAQFVKYYLNEGSILK
jgi:hypothetical protein